MNIEFEHTVGFQVPVFYGNPTLEAAKERLLKFTKEGYDLARRKQMAIDMAAHYLRAGAPGRALEVLEAEI